MRTSTTFLLHLLILSLLIQLSPTYGQITFFEDQFNGSDGDPLDPSLWMNPSNFTIEDNCLRIFTTGSGWEKAIVWSVDNYDCQNFTTNTYFAFRPSDPIIPGDQEAKIMVGYFTDYQDPNSFDQGVWVAVTGYYDTGDDDWHYFFGIQDVGTEPLPIERIGDFPTEFRLEIIPEQGDYGGVANLYLDGSSSPDQTLDWGYSSPGSTEPDEELSSANIYIAVQSNNYSGRAWIDYITADYIPPELIINSVEYRDVDSGSTEYTNDTLITANLDIDDDSNFAYLNFSENPDFTNGTGWITYQNPIQIDILTQDGERTIYCKGADEEYHESNVVNNSIFLDRQNPLSTVDPLPPEITSNPFDITYQYSDEEPASGVSSVELFYRFSNPILSSNTLMDNSPDKNLDISNSSKFYSSTYQTEWTSYGVQEPPTGTFSFDIENASGEGYYEFQVTAVDNAGNTEQLGDAEASTTVNLVEEEDITVEIVPNPFTPNNDGVNDTVSIITNLPTTDEVSLSIFNRYGDLIYKTSSAELVWDGRDNSGSPMVSGVYIYQIEYSGIIHNGTLTLVK